MQPSDLLNSALNDAEPPTGLSPELVSLWHTKAGNWEAAHDITQDIDTKTGSWIHALLHLIEGDVGNAGYWFNCAGRPPRQLGDIDTIWEEIAQNLLADA